jgi:hypothetical protein
MQYHILYVFVPACHIAELQITVLQTSRSSRISKLCNQDVLLGITTGYEMNGSEREVFIFSTPSKLTTGPTQPPIHWVPGSPSSKAKWPAHKTDRLSASSA